MKDYDLLKAMGKIRPDYIEEAARPKKRGRKNLLSRAGRWAALAAGLALAVLLGMNAPKWLRCVPAVGPETTPALTLPEDPNATNPTVSISTAADTKLTNSKEETEVLHSAGSEAASEEPDSTQPVPATSAVSASSAAGGTKAGQTDPAESVADKLLSFDSLQEFENYERSLENGLHFYYLPMLPEEQFQLIHIVVQEGVYLSITYKYAGGNEVAGAAVPYEITYNQYLFSENDETTEAYLQSHFREIQCAEKTYYYREDKENRSVNSAGSLHGYLIGIVADETVVYLYVRAVNSLEDALPYAIMKRHFIK